MTFIQDFDRRAAKSSHDLAWMLIKYARGLDPDRYPSDRKWRDHFICRAWAEWQSYRRYRKEAAE